MTSIHTLRKNEYADFLRLWGEAFGDGAEVHEGMKSVYGPEWKDFVVILEAPRGEDPGKATVPGKAAAPGKAAVPGKAAAPGEPAVAAALSQFAFGKLNNRVVLVSYAISTAKQLRGKGYGSMITRYARDVARILGAESMLCPADEGLVKFYKTLGYEPHCFACDFDVAKNEAGRAAYETAKFERINALRYNELREKYLAGREHVVLIEPTLDYIQKHCGTFYEICASDGRAAYRAIAVIEAHGTAAAAEIPAAEAHGTAAECRCGFAIELITEELHGADRAAAVIAAQAICDHMGFDVLRLRTPAGEGMPGKYVQAMLALPRDGHGAAGALPENAETKKPAAGEPAPYFGFPFD